MESEGKVEKASVLKQLRGSCKGRDFGDRQNVGDVWGRDLQHCRKKDGVPEKTLSFGFLG